jgi:hypothetical protein
MNWKNVLFSYVRNPGRSQISETFFNYLAVEHFAEITANHG